MTTAANTNNGGAVDVGEGGPKSPSSTALALYRHALDLCERLGIGPMSVNHWRFDDPPMTVYVWPEEWRPEWGKLRPLGVDTPHVVNGEATVEGVLFRCACPVDQAIELGIVEGA